jgi:hypothetical protein
MADPFTDLCILATEQQWCWNIHCGTCGHGVFRWAFRALSKGKRPRMHDWNVSWGGSVTFTTLEALNGPMPSFTDWPLPDQRALQDVVAMAEVTRIASACKFPDWLGYIGLALHYTEDAEAGKPRLTRALVPQLASLVDARSSAADLLADLAKPNTERRLTWLDLGAIETGIVRPHRAI